ncbi:discoidin domain-containing protein [Coprobacillus cateniformis]|uniref:discoidin domain-containing protein n=2 Tax=Coprobacillus cateniformis TaxID=100884 RepID=UPI000E449148|nr:discoidin domain-containing protein [Coprobacillus cateniformis]RGO09789.1 LPXTG cell wall anchor domain-containing protein [Coprobacillus cateniformis]RGO18702.1 LPXTG cell wall anchor domain-containing protein [Coprobacillus cateniformis]
MTKKLSKIILAMTLFLSLIFGQGNTVQAASQTVLTGQEAIATIKTRLKDYFLELDTIDDGSKVETCYVSKAEDYLKLIQEDGSFADVDYDAHNNAANGAAWSPYLALDRLQAIAIAYHKEGNSLYHSDAAKNGLDKAIKNWVTHGKRNGKPDGPYSSNWWENEVGVQLRFSRIGLFMEDIMSDEAFNIILTKLVEKTPVKYGTGQNNLWFDQNHVYHALLTKNETRLKEMVDDYLNYCLSTQLDDKTAEAVQIDNSFYMHGKQFYSNGYGMSMFRDMSFWIYILRETQFSIGQEVVTRMGNYMLNGTSWTIRGDIIELYLGYRPYKFDVGYQNYAEEYIEPLKRMITADPSRANEYQKVLNNIQNPTESNGKNGNYYMWRSGYGAHMKDGYGVNIKMDSKSVIGGEWRGSWSGQPDGGNLIYWSSSASSTVTVDGDEYTSVYPTFDWAHTPGTTTPNRIPPDYTNSGRLTNGSTHMIGASNGQYGSISYVMNKKETQATKSYFFFDDEFVALGAGINSKESTAIHTTLNQSKANQVTVDGQTVPTGTKAGSYTGKWIHNDKIGYIFPKETAFKVSNRLQKDNPSLWKEAEKEATPETFTAWVDHGVKPVDESYEYIVLPNKTTGEVDTYSKNIPIDILANTKDIQAVRHKDLNITQINFYKAGSLEYKDGYTVSVDKACNIIIDESNGTRKITVAVNDTEDSKVVNVDFFYEGQETTTKFVSKGLPYAGQPITLTEGQDDRYLASSSTTGHPVKNVIDGNESTYWESQGSSDEWISIFAGSGKYINSIDVVWGDNYATQYDVYGSSDGINYKKIKSITDGQGNTENITIGGLYKYIKVAMKNSHGSHYQVKEVKFHDSQLLSLNKTVEVSSTSTNDPGNVKENAVDGNTNTRWSSLRKESGFDKQEEWISVDLGRKARIDAIEVLWESACSNDFTIEVSNDNETWTTVQQNLKPDSSLNNQIVLDKSVEGRYVRIHSYASASKYGISIFELSIYGQNLSRNIALNKTADSSSDYKSDTVVAKAVDGNTQSKWSSGRKDPGYETQEEWMSVDLGQISYIDGVKIDWESGCSENYSIEVSNDNENWTTVKERLKSNTVAASDKHFIDNVMFDETLEARYIKIHSYFSRTKYGINIWELDVLGEVKDIQEPDVEEEINIALNKTSKASSEYLDTKDGNKVYYSSLAFDGNYDKVGSKQSRWASNRKTNDEWIYVDLTDTYNISKIVLDWEEACGKDYDLQVSLDGETWTTITKVRDNSAPKGSKHNVREYLYEEDIYARYVRMQGIAPAGEYGYSLWEFEVYGDLVKLEDVNIALNKPSTASSERKNPVTGFVLESKYAFDGSTENRGDNFQSRWVSTTRKDNPGVNVDSQYIQVDLEDVYNISKVVLNWEGACGKEYKIQVSDDGQTWTDISHVTDGKAGIKEFTYENSAVGRYVRMLGIVPVGQYGYSLWEFEVYGLTLKSELKEYYDENKNIDVSNYTPKSVAAYRDALNHVVEVYKNKDATSSQIIDAKQQLKDAIDGLTLKADKKALENIIKKANDISTDVYTEKTVKVLNEALKDAKNVYADENATQKQVTTAVSGLQKAIDGLVKKANKDALIKEIKKAEAIDKNQYTKETVKELEAALKKANDINKNVNVSQSEVDKAVKSLQAAIKGLEKKDDPVINVPDEDKVITVHNNNKDVTVKGQLPRDIQLIAEVLDDKQIEELMKKIEKQNSEFLQTAQIERLYDMKFLLNEEVYRFQKEVEVSLTIDESLKDKQLGIIYIDEQGNITKIPSRVEGNRIIFTAEHFSTYGIVSYGEEKKPETGDTTSTGIYVAIMLGMLGLGYVLLKKKKENDI